MADIIIRGMEMPKDCFGCHFKVSGGFYYRCKLTKQEIINLSEVNCPLIALPEGHGDLIDRNALPWEEQELNDFGDWSLKAELIDNAPTIVPADKDGAK